MTTVQQRKISEKLAEDLTIRLAEKLSNGLAERLGEIDQRLTSIENILAGEPDKEKIGIMERLRHVERWEAIQKKMIWLVIPIIFSNIVTIFNWIRMFP